MRVTGRKVLIGPDVLEDIANLLCRGDSDRHRPIELTVIPVHCCQGENLPTELTRRRIYAFTSHQEGLGYVETWVSGVKRYASFVESR